MRRSYIILAAALLAHVLLFWMVSRFVLFHADQTTDDTAGDFQRIALPVKPKEFDPSDDSAKAKPPTPPPLALIQVTSPTTGPSITVPSKINSATFSVPLPKMQIPDLAEAMMHDAGSRGGNGNGSGQSVGGAGGSHSANIFGMDVESEGPVTAFLDTSDSLKSQHDAVAGEIKKLLPDCSIVEINGVVFSTRETLEHLKANSTLSEYFANYYLSLVDGSIIPTVTDQIKNNKISGPMTIYYFSDFEDYADRKDVEAFSQLLQDNHIRFYAYSVEKEPSDAIKRLCVETGGNWKLKSAESP